MLVEHLIDINKKCYSEEKLESVSIENIACHLQLH